MKELDLTRPFASGTRRTSRRPAGAPRKRTAVPYERLTRPDASPADLDLDLAASFLGLEGADAKADEVVAKLRGYGLLTGEAPDHKVTNAALLLFARDRARHWHPGAGVRVMRVAGTARIVGHRHSLTRMKYAAPPIAHTIGESLRLAGELVRDSEPLRQIFFVDRPEYPQAAWREILLNAIAHRDYQGSEVEVVFYDDRLEVSSPGLPTAPLSIDELREGESEAKTRNPLICKVLEDAGVVANKGGGLVRAADEMAKNMLSEPKMGVKGGQFTVTLQKEPEFSTAGPGWKRIVSRLDLKPDQKRILLARPDGFTAEDYRRLNTVSDDQARSDIDDMTRKGIVQALLAASSGAPAEYFLTNDLDSRRWFLEDRLPRLRKHFRDKSRLRNTDYRALFEVSYPRARKELGLLVEDGFLRERGRGRAMHFLPSVGLRQ